MPSSARFHRRSAQLICIGFVMATGYCTELPAESEETARVVRLTDRGDNYKPAWAPDGDRIAFESTRDGNLEIYTMRADGSEVRRLTHDPSTDAGPSWTPDGLHLLFYSNRVTELNPEGRWQLYRLTVATSAVQVIDVNLSDAFRAVASPDGRQILFDAWHGSAGTHQLFISQSDGTKLRRLTQTYAYESAPQWSPSGTVIAFFSERDAPLAENQRETAAEIYRMKVDGSEVTRLTFLQSRSHYPSWSPDGTVIAFESDASGDLELFAIASEGSIPRNLTNHPARDTSVAWSPQGHWLLFVSNRDGRSNIYRMEWREQ